jgi:hypothetical protein
VLAGFDFLDIKVQSGTGDEEKTIGAENLIITDLSPSGMKIKIMFENKASLSMGDQSKSDKLIIGVTGKDSDGNPIKVAKNAQQTGSGATLSIMPMIDDESHAIKVLMVVAQVIFIVGFAVIFLHILLSYFCGVPNHFLNNFINALSLFAYIPLVSINHPGQVALLNKTLIKLVTFDLISIEWINSVIPVWDF